MGTEPVHLLAVDVIFLPAWIDEAAQPGAEVPLAFNDGFHIKYIVALNCAAASPIVNTPFAVS
jgi:hypothetical protein